MAAAVLTVLFCCAFSSKEVHAASSARLSKKSVTKKGDRIPKGRCQGKKSGNCQNPCNGSLPTKWERENGQTFLQD